jgi:hypothetical protein
LFLSISELSFNIFVIMFILSNLSLHITETIHVA